MTTNKSLHKTSRSYTPETVVKLWVRSGGRCEFNGCNDYLLYDSLSLRESNLSNIAHIVGLNGPRSVDPLPMEKRNNVDNLMLVCKTHHGIIDDKKLIIQYPKEMLISMKQVHEDRILHLTQIAPGNKTFIISFKAKIAGEVAQVPFEQMEKAVYPRYPTDKRPLEIDLTVLPDNEDKDLWEMGTKIITDALTKYYQPGIESGEIDHVSVFGLAPIPLLMFLGSKMSNKVTTEFYQRHRNPECWTWKTGVEPTNYKVNVLKNGDNKSEVAIMLNLSGSNALESLPEDVKGRFTIYEITLDGKKPETGCLKTRDDLYRFQATYQKLLGEIMSKHGVIPEIHLFPAIPAPIAILCGRELLKKAHPAMKVYDLNRKKGGFSYILTIN